MKNAKNSSPLSREQASALVDAISETDQLVLSAAAFEGEEDEWLFEATCQGEPDLEKYSEIARLTLGGNVKFLAEKVDPDIDWIARSLDALPPVVAGGFYIHASHNGKKIPPGLTPLHIEAAEAFGTGHHETTILCLEAINDVLKYKKPKRVLDAGTGTGILAIALAKRLKREVVASDIDPVAVRTAKQNARRNKVGKLVKTIEAKGVKSPKIRSRGRYDLIVANILSGPLVKMAPSLARVAKKNATIILSGILTRQAPGLITACGEQGIVLSHRLTRNEWTALVLQKC